MIKLFKKLFDSVTDGFLGKMLKGAGVSLTTSIAISTILSFLIAKFIASFGAMGSVVGLIGVSGLDQAISIVIGGMVARAMLSSANLSLTKATK